MGLGRAQIGIALAVGVLGLSGALAPDARAFAFRPAPGSPYPVGGSPGPAAVGDFTGGGLPDLAVTSSFFQHGGGSYESVSLFLADGSGGFRSAGGALPALGPESGGSLAVGDFNGDGKLDLAATTNAGVAVVLGNGDGTFTQPPGSPVRLGRQPLYVVVGEFNGDGKLDLVTVNADDTVSVLLGNGDGTFRFAPGSPISLGSGMPSSIAVSDFNGDGKPDLAVTDAKQGTVSILLGNGDGTFRAPSGSPIAVGGQPNGVGVGDFNGAGKQDLAIANAPSGGVSVLLGRGDGTFTPEPALQIGLTGQNQYVSGVVVGDLNSDGKQDLALTAFSDTASGLFVMLGDGGDGFRPAHGSPFAVIQPGGTSKPELMASGTFDGRLGLIVSVAQGAWWSGTSGAMSLLLAPLPSDPPTAAVAATPDPVAPGASVQLDASTSGDPLDRSIVDYRWDLGNGNFDHGTGSSPTIRATFPTTRTIQVRVQVTNSAGETAIASVLLAVRRPSRAARVGPISGRILRLLDRQRPGFRMATGKSGAKISRQAALEAVLRDARWRPVSATGISLVRFAHRVGKVGAGSLAWLVSVRPHRPVFDSKRKPAANYFIVAIDARNGRWLGDTDGYSATLANRAGSSWAVAKWA